MSKRTHYRNGDPISLPHNGCNSCIPCTVNRRLVHERGCPDSWRDNPRVCKWCGQTFYAANPYQDCCCVDCAEPYYD